MTISLMTQFRTKKILAVHAKTHGKQKRIKCPECPQTFVANYRWRVVLKNHVARIHANESNKFNCGSCPKTFSTRPHLRVHEISHDENRPTFPCSYCGKVLLAQRNLKVHVKKMHSGINPTMTCEYCDRKFWNNALVQQHIREQHLRMKVFECDQCPAKYVRSDCLQTHKQIHENESGIACTVCGIQFRNGTQLRKHIRKVHRSSTTQEVECTGCRVDKMKVIINEIVTML